MAVPRSGKGSHPARGWRSARLGLLGAACAALVATTMPAGPAVSAPGTPTCPAAVPARAVQQGMAVHGLTVTNGSTPDTFQGTVLGVLQDGIAPGLDMIMVQLSGSEITDVNGNVDKGIWAGMSGSPVYDGNGRLLGAVAYGLSLAPSDVAGVTPGAAMMKLINGTSVAKASQLAGKVAIPKTTAQRLVSSGALSTAQAGSGFRRLPIPFSVSGVSKSHLQKVSNRVGVKRPMVTGNSTSAAASPTPIVAGGNLAAALSYGNITYAGVGTATAICGGKVLGFGHPLLYSGFSTLFMNGADAIYIQKDATFGSFKVANVTAPVGRLVGDRLEGVHGLLNRFPRSTDVTSHVTAANGNSRRGETVISYRPALPYLASLHLLANADRVLDQLGGGTATVKWTFDGTRKGGATWNFTRQDKFASHGDITFASIWESYQQMSKILHNKFENVRIANVHYQASYSSKYHALQIATLQIKPGAKWITITSPRSAKRVNAGTDLPVRLTLTGSGAAPVVVHLSVTIPRAARGGQAVLFVEGGAGRSRTHATSFTDLLTKLAKAPHNNSVTATLYTERTRAGGRGGRHSDSQVVSDVVSGRKYVQLNVR
jgi:hypothetical protein